MPSRPSLRVSPLQSQLPVFMPEPPPQRPHGDDLAGQQLLIPQRMSEHLPKLRWSPRVLTVLTGRSWMITEPDSFAIRGSSSSAVTAVADMELMKCFDFCGLRPLPISPRWTSRALKSLSSTNSPMASRASLAEAS